jgi:hypothetical protein
VPKQPTKSGRLSNAEVAFIEANAGRMTPQDIAGKLNRSVNVVLKAMSAKPATPRPPEPETQSSIRLGLKQSAAWKQLVAEFEKDELAYFEEQYVALMDQFSEDKVLPTEENQVFKVIKLDLLKHRNAVKQRRVGREIERLEVTREQLLKLQKFNLPDSDEDVRKLQILDELLEKANSLQADLTVEYVKLEEKHQKLMEALKATRQQRVDRIESGKMDFLGLLRSLQEESVRQEGDRYIELMRRATAGELNRLSAHHQYGDSSYDRPILTPDTVGLGDAEVVSDNEAH